VRDVRESLQRTGSVAGTLELGPHRFDVTSRALVMGICNRTPDSFFDRGEHFDFDRFLRRVDQIVAEGADRGVTLRRVFFEGLAENGV